MKLYHIGLVAMLIGCGGSPAETYSSGPPQCKYNFVRQDPNGWLLTEPEVHFDFWGDWSSDQAFPSKEYYSWAYLIEEYHVFQRLAEYSIHEGTMDLFSYANQGSTSFINDSGTAYEDGGQSVLDDSSFENTLNDEIQHSRLPYPNDNSIYVVFLPPGYSTQKMLVHGWLGYHNHGTYAGQRYAYAIIAYPGNNSDATIEHEIAEAATDPGVGTGFVSSGIEIGDVCEGSFETNNSVVVQTLWSQALCQCQ